MSYGNSMYALWNFGQSYKYFYERIRHGIHYVNLQVPRSDQPL